MLRQVELNIIFLMHHVEQGQGNVDHTPMVVMVPPVFPQDSVSQARADVPVAVLAKALVGLSVTMPWLDFELAAAENLCHIGDMWFQSR